MKYLAPLLFLFLSISTFSQETSGLSLGQYNGLVSTKLNPAFINKSKHKWEIQLVGAHAFFENNYGFVDNTSLYNLARRSNEVEIFDPRTDITATDLPLPLIFNEAPRSSFVDMKAELLGPGIMLSLRGKYKIGASYKLRAMGSAHNIPSSLNYHNVADLQIDSVFQMNAFDAATAVWSEYALHIGMQQHKNLALGATIKYLRNHGSGVINTDAEFDFRYGNNNIIEGISGSSFQIAYTENTNNTRSYGSGLALDAGFTLSDFDDRGSEIGVAILDLGWMKNNGRHYTVNFQDATEINLTNYEHINTYDELLARLENDFVTIDSSANYSLFMPTALSIQYKRPISKYFSAEAYVVQKLKWSKRQLRRSNSFNVTATYERKHFSAFMPVTLYDFNDLRIGAALRFAFLTIGSDHITSLFGSSQQFRGSDIYVNIKVYPFSLGGGNNKDVQCYF